MSKPASRRFASSVARTGVILHRYRAPLWRIVHGGMVIGLFLWAAYSRFTLPLDPILDTDLIGYLGPALSKLNGGAFNHAMGLNFLYPGGLFLILEAARDLRAIVLVQHLLGLMAGGLFLLIWNRLRDLSPALRLGRELHQALGVVGAAVLLLSNQAVFLELTIRSDAVCIFFQLLTLWLTLQFFQRRIVRREGRSVIVYGCAAVASAWLLASLKPSFLVFALFTIAIVSWMVLRLPNRRRRLVFGATVAAIILTITLPEHLLRRSDPRDRRFLTTTLFAVHAKLIRAQMEADLRSGETGGYSPAWLEKAERELDERIAQTHALDPMRFPSLGFNPNWVLNGPGGLFFHWARDLGGEEPLLKFLRDYYWRALLHQPFAFAHKVAVQMSTFYTRPCPAFSIHQNLLLAPVKYLRSIDALQRTSMLPGVRVQDFGRAYLSRVDSLSRGGILKIREGAAIQRLNSFLAQGYCLICLAGGLIAIWLLLRHPGGPGGIPAALLTIFLCLPNLANTLGISVVHSMDVDRYSHVQFGAALLAELWIIRWLVDLSLPTIDRWASGMSLRNSPPLPPTQRG